MVTTAKTYSRYNFKTANKESQHITIEHHQFIKKKHQERKKRNIWSTKYSENNYKAIVSANASFRTLNINGLNSPIKRLRVAE